MSKNRGPIERWDRWLFEPVTFTRAYQILIWVFVIRILLFGFGPLPWGPGR